MSEEASTMKGFRLLDLPVEVIVIVAAKVEDHLDFYNLYRSCRLLQEIVVRQGRTIPEATFFRDEADMATDVLKVVGPGADEYYDGSSHKLRGVREDNLPCYACHEFRPVHEFLREHTSREYIIGGCRSNHRACIDCIVHGRGLAKLNHEPHPDDAWRSAWAVKGPLLRAWRREPFAQRPAWGYGGWRLAECSDCGKASWAARWPRLHGLELKLCTQCLIISRRQFQWYPGVQAYSSSLTREHVDPNTRQSNHRCSCGCGPANGWRRA